MAQRQRADIVVVGSGAGGSTIAGGLARAGFRVTLVEAGPQRTTPIGGHVRNAQSRETADEAHAAAMNANLVFPSGTEVAIPGLSGYKVGHGVGGMFAMWTNNCPRPHSTELPSWGKAEDWDTYLDRAYALLQVSADVFSHGVRSRRLLAAVRETVGALAQDRDVQMMPVAARWENGRLHFASAADLLGDPFPPTLDLHTDLIVHAVLHDGARATGVAAHPRAGGPAIEIAADIVVVAAGTIGSPKLLAASELDAGPALGRGIFDHPGFSSRVALTAELAADIPPDDPAFSIWVPYSPAHPWHNQLCRFPVNASPLPVDAPLLATADIFTWIPMDIDPDNRLIFDHDHRDPFGLPSVRAILNPSPATRERAASGLAEHFRIASAIGDLGNGWTLAMLRPGESTHFMGSCRMGPAHDGSSVVDENGRVWAYENLYVAGAAVLAQANAGNPTIACIAAALRTVDAIAGHV
jgi:choline dehydrogenase-like flavoprotein